jgi:hypothetical protein
VEKLVSPLMLSSAISFDFPTNNEFETGASMKIFLKATMTCMNVVVGTEY